MFSYNDGLESGGRKPRLWLAKGGEVVKFRGSNIPGFGAVASSRYEKNGKWSNTTYSLELAAGVRPLYFMSPLHGTWGDSLGSWGEVASELALPVDVAQRIVRGEYPKTAERLEKLEEFALAVEAGGGDTEVVVVSFGSPTNRAIREGYWENPKSSMASDGQTTVTVRPGQGEYGADWNHPEVVEPSGASVISSHHHPGMHGGSWAIEVVVPIAA